MADEADKFNQQRRFLRIRRVTGVVVGTVFLGALGSGVWDLLFRPSLREAGSIVTRMWTAADDAVFTTAALDPRPIPDLLLILVLVQLPLWFATWILLSLFLKPLLLRRLDLARARRDERYKVRILARLRWVLLGGCAFLLATYCIGRIGFSIVNESVLVWRVFHRNLVVLGSSISNEQEKKFLADFGRMQRRADFDAIRGELDAVALRNQVHLRWSD